MKVTDVFTPQRLPTITLVTDHLDVMKEAYENAMQEGGKLIRVVGPSKSGKTVFIKSAVGDSYLVPVTGAGITAPDDLWTRVLHGVGSDIGVVTQVTESRGGGYSVGTEAEGNIFVAKAKVSGEVSRERSSQATLTQTKAIDVLQQVINEISGSGLTIFIDDFHYIPAEIQTGLAQQIKRAVEGGVRIAAAAVPFRSEDVLRANDDLQGRILDFVFKYWSEEELSLIARRGFESLNIKCSDEYVKILSQEAAGSPQLMQSLCLETCRELGVKEISNDVVNAVTDEAFIAAVCIRVANAVDFSTTLKIMREGPLTRGTVRKAYVLQEGDEAADVYQILVKAIGLNPPSLHFSYSDLQGRVARVCKGPAPHFSEPCSHMARLVNDRFPSDKLEWDAEQNLLSIRDPYLLFAVRWGID